MPEATKECVENTSLYKKKKEDRKKKRGSRAWKPPKESTFVPRREKPIRSIDFFALPFLETCFVCTLKLHFPHVMVLYMYTFLLPRRNVVFRKPEGSKEVKSRWEPEKRSSTQKWLLTIVFDFVYWIGTLDRFQYTQEATSMYTERNCILPKGSQDATPMYIVSCHHNNSQFLFFHSGWLPIVSRYWCRCHANQVLHSFVRLAPDIKRYECMKRKAIIE